MVDNASGDGTVAAARALAPDGDRGRDRGQPRLRRGLQPRRRGRLGRARSACSTPTRCPSPGWRDAIELPHTDGRGWTAWQALVTADGGRTINTRGGVLHFTGIGWAGGAGRAGRPLGGLDGLRARDRARLRLRRLPGDPPGRSTSGSARCPSPSSSTTRTSTSRCACGSPAARLGVEDAARVDHDYEFAKGPSKWLYLERNRWATLIRTYPARAARAAGAGAAGDRARAARRRGGRRLAAAEAARLGRDARLAAAPARASAAGSRRRARSAPASSPPRSRARLDSAYLGRAGRSRALAVVLGAYWAIVRRLLGAARRG